MITIDDIKTQLTNQDLSGLGFYSTQFSNKFELLSTANGIDIQLSDAISEGATYVTPIFYLQYDSIQNLLNLKIYRFKYVNQSWIYYSTIVSNINWIYSENESKYLITYPSGSTNGYSFNRDIPFIEKTNDFVGYVCGGTIPEGIVGFVYGKYADDVGGYYYTKLSNNPQPPCCSELQLENCGGTYPDTGICVQSGCCIDNISVC